MSKPKGGSPFWINLAAKAAARATRLGQQMRDEWRAGQAEGPQPIAEPNPVAAPEQAPASVSTAWWEVLQVPRTASKEEIQQSWRRLIKENHPDKAGHLPEEMQAEVEKEAKRLNDAYESAMKEK